MPNDCLQPYTLFAVMVLIACNTIAQSQTDTLVTMKDAVLLSEQHYHLLKAAKDEADAANANVKVAKYSRLPTIDATYQANIATANNLTGMFYPYGILPITGPPSSGNNYNPATGSAASLLLNWQAVTFGQRNAQIDVSEAEANSKNLEWKQESFKHKINVISGYLDVLLSIDIVHIQQQNIQRVEVNLKESRTLVTSGIRPGVDTALFLSELSKAKIDLLNAQKLLQTQQWLLAQLMVIDLLPVPADTNFLNKLPVAVMANDTSFSNHPVIQYAQSEFDLSKSKENLLRKSYLPKLNIWGGGFARGSGFQQDQTIKTWDGLAFSRYNYGAGLQLAFPIMEYGEAKRQLQQQDFLSKASEERLEENKEILTTQQRIANTTFSNSIAVATETQQQLKSGQYAFTAMQVRYNTGLANFSDLIQAQYNLLKSELDVKNAYWDVWKALLLEAAVKGDENIFLVEIK
jgi:outer membrane protein TolC